MRDYEPIEELKRPEIKAGVEVKVTDGPWKGNHGVVLMRPGNIKNDLAHIKFLVREETISVHFLTTEVDPIGERQLLTKEEKRYLGLVVALDPETPIAALKKVRWEWIVDLAATSNFKEGNRIAAIVKKFDEEIRERESAEALGMSHYDFVCMETAQRIAAIQAVCR